MKTRSRDLEETCIASGHRDSLDNRRREDVAYWGAGITFIFALNLSIYGFGWLRGWDAVSGHTHNISVTSRDRFLPEPFIEEPGVRGRYGSCADGRWYYWKLPPDQVTMLTRLLPWLCYSGHQILIWWVIYKAQLAKNEESHPPTYSTQMRDFNKRAIKINVLFHLLHLLQTHLTYDATAQDVSVASSQSSVIMMAIFVFLIEYKERGLFFGWPTSEHSSGISSSLRLSNGPIDIIRKYHAYPFAWAAIYTFWYHPMENTLGHALGFFYTWVLLLQGSLMYTKFHLNKYWRLFLEVWVIAHGYQVARQTGGPDMLGTSLWPMFVFGFLIMITVTQIFTLKFLRDLPLPLRILPFLVAVGFIIYSYSWIPDAKGRVWVRMPEVTRISATYYMFVPLAWLILWILMKCQGMQGDTSDNKTKQSAVKHFLLLFVAFMVYICMVMLSVHIQIYDWKQHVVALMVILVFIFMVAVCITMVLFIKPAMAAISPRKNI